jgi:hypothetical protein
MLYDHPPTHETEFNIDYVDLDPIARVVLPLAESHGWVAGGGFVRDCLVNEESYNDIDFYPDPKKWKHDLSKMFFTDGKHHTTEEILNHLIDEFKLIFDDIKIKDYKHEDHPKYVNLHLKRVFLTCNSDKNAKLEKQLDFVLVEDRIEETTLAKCFDSDEICYINGKLVYQYHRFISKFIAPDNHYTDIVSMEKLMSNIRQKNAKFIGWHTYVLQLDELKKYLKNSVVDLKKEKKFWFYLHKVNQRVQQKIDRKWTMNVKLVDISTLDIYYRKKAFADTIEHIIEWGGPVIDYHPKATAYRTSMELVESEVAERFNNDVTINLDIVKFTMEELCPHCLVEHESYSDYVSSYRPSYECGSRESSKDKLKLSIDDYSLKVGDLVDYQCGGHTYQFTVVKISCGRSYKKCKCDKCVKKQIAHTKWVDEQTQPPQKFINSWVNTSNEILFQNQGDQGDPELDENDLRGYNTYNPKLDSEFPNHKDQSYDQLWKFSRFIRTEDPNHIFPETARINALPRPSKEIIDKWLAIIGGLELADYDLFSYNRYCSAKDNSPSVISALFPEKRFPRFMRLIDPDHVFPRDV